MGSTHSRTQDSQARPCRDQQQPTKMGSTHSRTQDSQERPSRAAEGQAASSSPSSVQSSPATLLDLSDAHGLIYQMLPDTQSRAAFRQCCKTVHRSPSVNAHLETLDFGSMEWTAQPLRKNGLFSRRKKRDSDRYATKTMVNAIASFPKHATLRKLRLTGGSDTVKINFRKLLTNAEALDPISEAVRKRLSIVKAVDTEADSLEVAEAEKLTALLPQLEELRLQKTCFGKKFLGTLASRLCKVHSLELDNCTSLMGSHDVIEGVAKLTSLRSLKLDLLPRGSQLLPLTCLQSLRHLSVSSFLPLGLGQMVSSVHLDSLELDIWGMDIWDTQFPSEHFASSTLTTLAIRVDLYRLPDWISMLDFPCLKELHFKSVCLFVDDSPQSEEVLERVERVAGWLGRQGLTWTGEDGSFHMSCGRRDNYRETFMSAAFTAALIKRLFPMVHQLVSICTLSLEDVKLSHASLRDMATLFPHVSHLMLSGVGLCSPLALADLLNYMPLLNSVQVNGTLVDLVENGVQRVMLKDLLALLCAARDGRRELSLRVWNYYRWSELEATWESEASKHPLYAPVKLFKY